MADFFFKLVDLIERDDLPSPTCDVSRADETQEQSDVRETQVFIETLAESASKGVRTEIL